MLPVRAVAVSDERGGEVRVRGRVTRALVVALVLAGPLAPTATARADVLPVVPTAPRLVDPLEWSIAIEPEDARAYVVSPVPLDDRGRMTRTVRVVSGEAIALRRYASPRVIALASEAAVLDEWGPAPEGPASTPLLSSALDDLRVAAVLDTYAARVEGDAVRLRLLRSEYVHHGGTRETVPARADGTRGPPSFALLDGPLTLLGDLTSCCCWPCFPALGLVVVVVVVVRRARKKRRAAAS